MEILDEHENGILVRLTANDVIALNNALNESLHIDEWEFETRMGITKSEAQTLLSTFSQLRVR